VSRADLEEWEVANELPELTGVSTKAVDWGRQCRYDWLVRSAAAWVGVAESNDHSWYSDYRDPARKVTSASYWISHRTDQFDSADQLSPEPVSVSSTAPVTAAGQAPANAGAADLARAAVDQNTIVEVLGRMGVSAPADWDGLSDFRVPAAALGMPHGPDDGQGVTIRPRTGTWIAWHGYELASGTEKSPYRGDVIRLVQTAAGITYPAAVRLLASEAEIPVVRREADAPLAGRSKFWESPVRTRTSLAEVLDVNRAAWAFYTEPVLAQQAARYLASRSIDVTALEREAGRPLAGHTPGSTTGLVDHLRQAGFSDDAMVDAGWANRRPDATELTDRFRHRLLIPFRDDQDNVLGVTGRDVTGVAKAKYLNTSATIAYDKSAILYRPVRAALDPGATVIAVEGTLDALAISAAAATAGVSAKFAPCSQSGLSLTTKVAPVFFGLSDSPPLVCADGDLAGRTATEKWARLAMGTYHREVLCLALPGGKDPAEWLSEHGTAGLATFTRQATYNTVVGVPAVSMAHPVHAGEFLAAAELARHPTTTETVAAETLPGLAAIAAQVPDPAAVNRFAAAAGAIIAGTVDNNDAAAPWRTGQLLHLVQHELHDDHPQHTLTLTAAPALHQM